MNVDLTHAHKPMNMPGVNWVTNHPPRWKNFFNLLGFLREKIPKINSKIFFIEKFWKSPPWKIFWLRSLHILNMWRYEEWKMCWRYKHFEIWPKLKEWKVSLFWNIHTLWRVKIEWRMFMDGAYTHKKLFYGSVCRYLSMYKFMYTYVRGVSRNFLRGVLNFFLYGWKIFKGVLEIFSQKILTNWRNFPKKRGFEPQIRPCRVSRNIQKTHTFTRRRKNV